MGHYPNLNELAQRSHELSRRNGFWESQLTIGITNFIPEKLMLIVSELSEALESYRSAEPFVWYKPHSDECTANDDHEDNVAICNICNKPRKAEGLGAELADAVIRIGDLAARLGIDLAQVVEDKHKYNTTRAYKHGKVC